MKTISHIPMAETFGGALTAIVDEALALGAKSSNDNNDHFELHFEKAADAKLIDEKLKKLLTNVIEIVKNDPVDDPDQSAE